MKPLFWITAVWKKNGDHFSMIHLVAAATVTDGKNLVIDTMALKGISVSIGQCFEIPECFCVHRGGAKVIEAQQL